MEICKQQSEIEMRHLAVISIYGYVGAKVLPNTLVLLHLLFFGLLVFLFCLHSWLAELT